MTFEPVWQNLPNFHEVLGNWLVQWRTRITGLVVANMATLYIYILERYWFVQFTSPNYMSIGSFTGYVTYVYGVYYKSTHWACRGLLQVLAVPSPLGPTLHDITVTDLLFTQHA